VVAARLYNSLEKFDIFCSKSESAKIIAQLKIPIFPVHSAVSDVQCSCGTSACPNVGKHPRTRNGFKDATCNEHQIEYWWSQWPHANIGIRTGQSSGLVVLDEDPRNGGADSFRELEIQIGRLPTTWIARTGGGGRHFYFQYFDSVLGSRTGLMPGLDFKAEAGYVIGPPSDHKSGSYYSWDDDFNPSTTTLAPLPESLLKILKSEARPKPKGQWREGITSKVTEGARNTTMTRVVGGLLRSGLHPREIYGYVKYLNETNFNPPLSLAEMESVFLSIVDREYNRRMRGL
jgi:hypothetical protein